MANVKDKTPSSLRKERDSFLEDLKRFHNTRGTPIKQVPCLGGREIDLFSLYNKVTALGGWEKVNLNERWEDIQENFNIPRGCTNASQALKTIYIRYLDVYEKIHYLGEDPDRKVGESEEQNLPGQRKKTTRASMVPMMYNHTQHHVAANVRESQNFVKLLEPGLTDKLEKSLLSGLPNEIDFAVNICTLLSSEGKHTLQLERCSHLLELLMAHVGIFDVGPGSMKELHLCGWKPVTKRNFLRFWWESVEKKEIRQLICPDIPLPEEGETSTDHCEDIQDVLCIGRDLGLNDKEGQRVLQISMILRNLSFEVDNMKVLVSSQLVLRFLMLGVHCRYHSIRQLSLDSLGNLCLQMELKIRDCVTTPNVIATLSRCLKSSDKFEVVTGLDMLSKLCQQESNEEALCELLPHEVYESVVSFLTVHDIQLIVYTLECLYQLSELGEVSTSHIARISRAISCLISLVSIEAQSYGPESIKGIKVVEHIPANLTSPIPTQRPPEAAPTPVLTSHGSKTVPQKAGAPVPASQGVTPIRPKAAPTPPPQTMRPPVSATPPPGRPTPPPTPPKSDPVLTKWLQCHYEAIDGTAVSQLEIYLGYVRVCGQKKMPDSKQFAMALRTSFPRLEIISRDKPDGTPEVFLKGIKRREIPLSLQQDRANSATPPPVRFPITRLQPQGGNPSPPGTPQPPGQLRNTQPQRLKFIQYKPSAQPTPICNSNVQVSQQAGGQSKQFSVPRPPTPLSPLATSTKAPSTMSNAAVTRQAPPHSPLGTQTGKTPTLAPSGGQNISRPPTPQSPMGPGQSQPAPMLQQVLLNKLATGANTLPPVQTPPPSPHLQQQPIKFLPAANMQPNNTTTNVQQSLEGNVVSGLQQGLVATSQLPSVAAIPTPNFNTSGGNTMYFGNMQQQGNQPGSQNIQPQGNPHNTQFNAGVSPQVQHQVGTSGLLPQQQGQGTGMSQQIFSATPSNAISQQSSTMQPNNMVQQMGVQSQNTPVQMQGNMNQNQPLLGQGSVPIIPGGFLSQLQMSPPRTVEESSDGSMNNQLQGNMNYINQQNVNTFPAHNINNISNQQSINNSQNITHPTLVPQPSLPMPNISGGQMAQTVNTNVQNQIAVQQGAFSNQISANNQVSQNTQQNSGSQPAQYSQLPPVAEQNFQKKTVSAGQPPGIQHQQNQQCTTNCPPVVQPGQPWTNNQWHGQGQSSSAPQGHGQASGFQNQFQQFAQVYNSQSNATSQTSGSKTQKPKKPRPPRVKNQNKSSSKKSSKTEQGQMTLEPVVSDSSVIPMVITDSTSCDNRSEVALVANSQSNRLSTDTAVFYKENCPPVVNEVSQERLKTAAKDLVVQNREDPHFPVEKPGVDLTESSIEKSAEVTELKTTQAHCDDKSTPTVVTREAVSNIVSDTHQPTELFNGLSHTESVKPPPNASKELSPLFNSSVEEKKARIAQLMKHTDRLKEQFKGINGASHHIGNTEFSSGTLQGVDQSRTGGANSELSLEYQVNLDVLNNKHPSHVSNGYPEPVNGGHMGNLTNLAETGGCMGSTNNLTSSALCEGESQACSNSNIGRLSAGSGTAHQSLPHSATIPSSSVQSPGEASPPVVKDSLPLGMQVDGCVDGSDDETMDTSEHIPVQSVTSAIPLYSMPANQSGNFSTGILLPTQSLPSCQASTTTTILPGQRVTTPSNPSASSINIESQSSVTMAMTQLIPSVQTTASFPCTVASSVSASLSSAPTLLHRPPQPSPSQKLVAIQPRPSPVSMASNSHMISTTQPTALLSSSNATQLVMAGGVHQPGSSIQISLPPGVPLKGQGYIQCQGQPQVMTGHLQQFVATHGQPQVVGAQSPPPPPMAMQTSLQSYVTSQGQTFTSVTGRSQTQQLVQGQHVAMSTNEASQALQLGVSSGQPQQVVVQGPVQFVTANQQPVMQPLQTPHITQTPGIQGGQGQQFVNNINTQVIQGQVNLVQSSVNHQTVQNNIQPCSNISNNTPQTLGSNTSMPIPAPQTHIPQPQGGGVLCEPSPVSLTPAPLTSPIPAPVAKRRASNKKGEKADRPKKPKKSRSKSTDSGKGSQSSPGVGSPSPVLSPLLYLCEWNGCNRAFELFKSLAIHVNRNHIDMRSDRGLCHWTGCDQLIRQKWSLITHIQEKHLSEAIARAAAVKRQQMALCPRNTPPITQPAAPPPVYPDDAAVQAIRRFTMKPPYPEFTEMKEGPVTKHIRLTSALILRNLARYSDIGRSELKKYEHLLSYVALSPVESSAAVSNCLYELHKHYEATTTEN